MAIALSPYVRMGPLNFSQVTAGHNDPRSVSPREAVGRAAAGSPREQPAYFRVLQDVIDGALHCRRELIPKPRSLGVVIPNGCCELSTPSLGGIFAQNYSTARGQRVLKAANVKDESRLHSGTYSSRLSHHSLRNGS